MPDYGLVKLPGLKDLGMLYRATYNCAEMLFERLRPTHVLFCLAFFDKTQTTSRALNGVQSVLEMAAYDYGVEAMEAIESKARKAVLGRGSFGGKDPNGKMIPGLGRKQAKAAVAKWAEDCGFVDLPSDDVSDALVLLAYDRMLERGK